MSIEKYEGSFQKDELGVTQIPNKTIHLLKHNAEVLGFYVYLLSLPAGWNLHYRNLMEVLDMSKDKVYKNLNLLKDFNLLSSEEIREQGRYVRNHYRLHLRPTKPIPVNTEMVSSPFPCLPEAVNPDPVNPEAYITKNLPILDINKTNTTTNGFSQDSELPDSVLASSSSGFVISLEVDRELLRFNQSFPMHAKDNREFLFWCKFLFETKINAVNMEDKIRILKSWIKKGGLTKPTGFGEQITSSPGKPTDNDEIKRRNYLSSFDGYLRTGMLPADSIPMNLEGWISAGKPERAEFPNYTINRMEND